MNYDCIIINGDSYSAPGQSGIKVYGDFLSEKLGIPVNNVAIHGSSNQRILRSSIEYIHQTRKQYKNPLILIGWSFIHRAEIWYHGNNKDIIDKIPDTTINPASKLITLDWILESKEASFEHKALADGYGHPEKALTDFYTNLYMFSNLLESLNLGYCFFSAARNFECAVQQYPHVNQLIHTQQVIQNPKIFRLHNFCISTWAKQNDPDCNPMSGHLSQSGHEKFADFIINNMPI
jgi:hypothetical protein